MSNLHPIFQNIVRSFGMEPGVDCDRCGELIAARDVAASVHEAPHYMPDSFRKAVGRTHYCESCREVLAERDYERAMEG